MVRPRCHVTHSNLNPLLTVRDVGRTTVMDSLLKPMERLAITEPLPWKVGVLPDKNESLIGRAESSSEEIVEGVQIAVPRHRQAKHSRKLSSALGQRGIDCHRRHKLSW